VESVDGILTIEDAISTSSGENNNRKFYFTHALSQDGVSDAGFLDGGVTLTFRARLTPSDAKAEIPLPDGYGIFSSGRGMFGIRQSSPGALISFSLVRSVEDATPSSSLRFSAAGLTMNRLNGDSPQSGTAVNSADDASLNPLLPLDPTVFHEFWITIQANDATAGNGTHRVQVYLDGNPTPTSFDVTAGQGSDQPTSYLALALNNSTTLGAMDVDFFAYSPGVIVPTTGDPGEPKVTLTATTVDGPQTNRLVNGSALILTAKAFPAPGAFNHVLYIYDDINPTYRTLLFQRAYDNQVAEPTLIFKWMDVPLGSHLLNAEIVSDGETNRTAQGLSIEVVGRPMGFSRLHDLTINPAPQQVDSATSFGCQLDISNRTEVTSNPLRVRLMTTRTYLYRENDPNAPTSDPSPVPGSIITEFPPVVREALPSGQAFTVSIDPTLNILCPIFEGNFENKGYQHHVYAVLEEQLGDDWLLLDRAKIISSYPGIFFPPNEGVTGQESPENTNDFSFLVALDIDGPASVEANAEASYTATAQNSKGVSGPVQPTWSVTQPCQISASGKLIAGEVGADTPVQVLASYTASIVTRTATQQVVIVKASAPLQITWTNPANIVYGTPLGSSQLNATSNVPGTFQYAPPAGMILDAGSAQTLSAIFSPEDTGKYPKATNSVLIDVSQAPLTVAASDASRPYGLDNPAFTGSLTGLVNGDPITATYLTTATSNSPVGTYPIVPTLADPSGKLGNYLVVTNNGTLTITKADQVLTFEPVLTKAFGIPPFLLNATSSAGLPVVFVVVAGPATVVGAEVTLTGTGEVTIRADQGGDSNRNPAPSVTQSFTVVTVPVILSDPVITENQIRFTIHGLPHTPYTVEASPDLADWARLQSRDSDATGNWEFQHAFSLTDGRKFYRVRVGQ
jgi:hypothetical protein